MKLWRITLVLITTGALALPAPAGILFGKKTKPNPAERVPELIVIVQSDKDESKRAAAAEELRQYDPTANPDVVPVLINVLMNDAKPAVRSEAAESLGKIRPVSQEAGWALEQAQDKDSSWRVRTKARYVLMSYHWAGYHTDPKMKDGPTIVNPKDQPADKGKAIAPVPAGKPSANAKAAPDQVVITPVPAKAPIAPASRPIGVETAAPPLADPPTKPAPSAAPRPLPQGPTQPPVPPAAPAKVAPAPLPPVSTSLPAAPTKVEPAGLPAIPLPPASGGPSLNGPGE